MSETQITPMFGRVATAMITPFHADGSLDLPGAERLANHLIDNGTDSLVVAGTTGESPTLTHSEKLELFRAVKNAVGGRAKVIAGVGSFNTQETVTLSREAEECGADALLVVAPYYNKPSQEGLYRHFEAVAAATPLPVMLYNIPGRTSVNIEPATIIRLAEIENIVAIKESPQQFDQVNQIVQNAPDDFLIYSGDDPLTLPMLAVGAVGVVSVTAHVIGRDLQKMISAYLQGDWSTAQRIHKSTLALTRALFCVPNPAPTKAALSILGVTSGETVRLPLVEAPDRERALIHAALKEYGLLRA
ncbi:4-hydroxy-tetrahydrodipicolinate synthase [Capsulimonas corticalis]|uniref:4-hydroxy-tetrahydrodipicolinate synthase n=1 Tax=Capsulimonas corticalis TaxID=2219043 RepID=A0A402CXH0_9BACT|nr:4-hydroxy-tetrahydrodipicolinate synthase [Capsulimonas corticalis]BDI32271.1 4-hydroxy-tetrahydrodipicolinate synthase [Capsulimonas corticalis]